jgi:acyl carrier protein
VEIETTVHAFIVDELLRGQGTVTPETSLFQGGILDSMNLAEMIQFLETHFHIKVNAREIRFENLDSITRVAAYVRAKRAG